MPVVAPMSIGSSQNSVSLYGVERGLEDHPQSNPEQDLYPAILPSEVYWSMVNIRPLPTTENMGPTTWRANISQIAQLLLTRTPDSTETTT